MRWEYGAIAGDRVRLCRPKGKAPCPTPSSSGPRSNPSPMCERKAVLVSLCLTVCGSMGVAVYIYTCELASVYLWPFATVEALMLRILHVASVRVNVFGGAGLCMCLGHLVLGHASSIFHTQVRTAEEYQRSCNTLIVTPQKMPAFLAFFSFLETTA